jgi:hypothetical protein
VLGDKALTICAVVIVALANCTAAFAKGAETTICGRDQCRTVSRALALATLPGRVLPPPSGRYYTISMRVDTEGGNAGWKVVYEANRQLIRGADAGARAFLGRRWVRLARDLRRPYANAVRGLAPLRTPPPVVG